MIASLANLPLEIKLHIVRYLVRQKDISALAQASQDLYRSFNPILYQEDARRPDRWALPWACSNGIAATAIKALEAGSPADASHWHPYPLCTNDWSPVSMLDIAFYGRHAEVFKLIWDCEVYRPYLLDTTITYASAEILRICLPHWGDGTGSRRYSLACWALEQGNEKRFEIFFSSNFNWKDDEFRQWPKLALKGGSLALFRKVTELGLDELLEETHKSEAWRAANLTKSIGGLELAKFVRSRWPSLGNSTEDLSAHKLSACATGNAELLKWLLQWGGSVDELHASYDGSYKFMEAAIKSKNLETVELCLTSTIPKEMKLFFLACACGTPEIVRAFVTAGADPHAVGENENVTALRTAISAQRNDIIQCLLEYEVEVPKNVFHLAQMTQNRCLFPYSFDTVQQLLARGASLVSENPVPYEKPLIIAVCEKTARRRYNTDEIIRLVQLLLDHGADINDRAATEFVWHKQEGCRGRRVTGHVNALRKASRGSPRLVQFLIDNGADALAANARGYTALHDACYHRNVGVVRLLLDKGAEVNGKTIPDLETPLISACRKQRLPKGTRRDQRLYNVMKLLLERGADPNAATKEGSTPLHLLASGYCFDLNCFYLLLDYGADINAKDKTDGTPLLAACRSHDAPLVRALLTAGADINARDERNRSALEYARRSLETRRHTAVTVDVLLSFGAEVTEDLNASLWSEKNPKIDGMQDVLLKHGLLEIVPPGSTAS